MSKRFVTAILLVLVASALSAEDLVPRRCFVDRPAGDARSAAHVELVYQVALACVAEYGGVEVAARKEDADFWLTFAIEATESGAGRVTATAWDKLASFGKAETVKVVKVFPLTGFGPTTLHESFGVPLGRWIAGEFPMVEVNIREIVTVKVVKETKVVDLALGAGLLVKTLAGATVTLYDGRAVVADANGLAKFSGIPQNSTVSFTVTLDGYYPETRTVVFGKMDEKTMVELSPVPRWDVMLVGDGYGYSPAFQWEALPDTLIVGLVLSNNYFMIQLYSGGFFSGFPRLFFLQPEIYAAWRFGSSRDPIWFEAGIGVFTRFDLGYLPSYPGGFSLYVPGGFRLRLGAFGRFDDQWSIGLLWGPSVFYSDTIVNHDMWYYTGRTEFSPNSLFRYMPWFDFPSVDPHSRWFYVPFEVMLLVSFSF